MPSILLVCTANICRSPMGEALLRARLAGLAELQSCGTHAASRGEPIDPRAAAALARRDLSLPKRWRSRRVQAESLGGFDMILAMDHDNLRALRQICPPDLQDRLQLFMDRVPGRAGDEVPDPYFGAPQGFDNVLDLLELGARAIAQGLRR